jgi:hypothetical protein
LKILIKLFFLIKSIVVEMHTFRAAMGNLRPTKFFSMALLEPLKYAYFKEKSTKSEEKVYILALDLTV